MVPLIQISSQSALKSMKDGTIMISGITTLNTGTIDSKVMV